MLDVCDQCGSSVSKRLLRCSNGTVVFHRECANGHNLHRTTGKEDHQTTDWYRTSSSFVIVAGMRLQLSRGRDLRFLVEAERRSLT